MASQKQPIVNSPFSDHVGKDTIPYKGSNGGSYDSEPNLPSGMPSRKTSPNGLPELYRDGGVEKASKLDSPKVSGGPVTNSPFKDAAGKK